MAKPEEAEQELAKKIKVGKAAALCRGVQSSWESSLHTETEGALIIEGLHSTLVPWSSPGFT